MGPVVLIGYFVALVMAMFWGAIDSLAQFLVFTMVALVGVVAFVTLGKVSRGG